MTGISNGRLATGPAGTQALRYLVPGSGTQLVPLTCLGDLPEQTGMRSPGDLSHRQHQHPQINKAWSAALVLASLTPALFLQQARHYGGEPP